VRGRRSDPTEDTEDTEDVELTESVDQQLDGLTGSAKRVYQMLVAHGPATYAEVISETMRTDQTVRNALLALEARGLVHRELEPKPGTASRWVFATIGQIDELQARIALAAQPTQKAARTLPRRTAQVMKAIIARGGACMTADVADDIGLKHDYLWLLLTTIHRHGLIEKTWVKTLSAPVLRWSVTDAGRKWLEGRSDA
jgi:predicted transcriptional regulator